MFQSFHSTPFFWLGILSIFAAILYTLGSSVKEWIRKNKKRKKAHNIILPSTNEITTIMDVAIPETMVVNANDSATELTDLSEAESFTITNFLGEELKFIKLDSDTDNSEYREIKLAAGTNAAANAVRVAAPLVQHAVSVADLSKMAPNGLFTSTVSPQLLSHFVKDGTYTTMVHGPNGVISHGGFKEIPGLSGINPVMALNIGMQTMAAISGQYYLKKINLQLGAIGKQLVELKSYFHGENRGRIVSTRNRLEVLSGHEVVGNNDIIEIRDLANDVNAIYETYRMSYIEKKDAVLHYQPSEKGVQKALGQYQEVVNDFKTTAYICSAAYQVSLQAKLMEIIVEMRINPLSEQLRDLERDALALYNNPFDPELVTEPPAVFNPIIENAKKCLKQTTILEGFNSLFLSRKKKKEQEHTYLQPFREDVEQLTSFADSIMDMGTAKAVVEGIDIKKQQKVLVLPGNNDQPGRLFIATP